MDKVYTYLKKILQPWKVQNVAFFEDGSHIDDYKIPLNPLLDEYEIWKITVCARLRS